jgi:proteasome beta subunit
LISYKKFDKIIPITDNVIVTVAGTVSDVQLLVKYLKAELKLKDIRTGRETTVKEAASLLGNFVYNNIRKYSLIPGISHFILAGKDSSGLHLYDLSPDGSIAEIDDYISSGSGSVMAYGVLETLYKKGLSVEEGVKLAAKGINAAVQRDIASGNGIDIYTVTKDGIKKVFTKELEIKIEP